MGRVKPKPTEGQEKKKKDKISPNEERTTNGGEIKESAFTSKMFSPDESHEIKEKDQKQNREKKQQKQRGDEVRGKPRIAQIVNLRAGNET